MRTAVAALVLVVALAVPTGASGSTELIVSGNGTATAELTLSRPVRLDVLMSRATTRGRYAGFLMHRAGEGARYAMSSSTHTYGSLWARDLVSSEPGRPALDFGVNDKVPAGRYRLVLIADGPAEIRIPALGLTRSLRVVARRPGRSRLVVEDRSTPADIAAMATGVRTPVTVGRSTWAMAVVEAFSETPGATVENLQACVTAAGDQDCPVAASGYVVSAADPFAASVVSHAWPGRVHPGSYVALRKRVGAGTVRRVRTAVLTFEVP